MWHSHIQGGKAKEMETDETCNAMDINMRMLGVRPVPVEKSVSEKMTIPTEPYNEAIQSFGLVPRFKWQPQTQQDLIGCVKTNPQISSSGKPHMSPGNMIFRQDSELIIDKQRGKMKVVPPESDPVVVLGHDNSHQLGVKTNIAYKRMLAVEKEEEKKKGETDSVLQNGIGALNIGMKQPAKLDQSRVKTAVCQLINNVNKACQMQSPYSMPPQKVLIAQNFDLEDFDVPDEEKLFMGTGTFGNISSFKIRECHNIIQKDLIPSKSKPQTLINRNEVEVPMNFPDCRFITRVLGLFWDGHKASILQEYAGLSIRELMQIPKFCSYLQKPQKTLEIMLGLFKALEVLHNCGIKHRDVKPENTTWDPETEQVRLIDFASCRTLQDKEDGSLVGTTPEYLPPYVSASLLGKKGAVLSNKADVWGAGMIGLYILKGGHPVIQYFAGMSEYPQTEEAGAIRILKVLKQLAQLSDPLPEFFLEHPDRPMMAVLLKGCLSVNEESRWTATQAVKFLQDYLKPEGPTVNKFRRLEEPSKMKMQSEDNKVIPSGQASSNGRGIREILKIKTQKGSSQTYGAPDFGRNSTLHVPGTTAGQFPPAPQLATAVTPTTKPLMPQKMQCVQQPSSVSHWHVGPPAGDEGHLAWLKETFGAKKVATVPPKLLNLITKLGTAREVRPGAQSATAVPEVNGTPGRPSYAFSGCPRNPVGLNFSFGAAASADHNVTHRKMEKMSRKVLPPLPDSPEPHYSTMLTPSPSYAKPQVVGMWGQPSPPHRHETIVRSRREALQQPVMEETKPVELAGNIPNILNDFGAE